MAYGVWAMQKNLIKQEFRIVFTLSRFLLAICNSKQWVVLTIFAKVCTAITLKPVVIIGCHGGGETILDSSM
jgi:hypothetical protein